MTTFNELFEGIQQATLAALRALAAEREKIGDSNGRAVIDIHIEATSTHMVELRTMLFMALGGEVIYPAEVMPLEQAIKDVTTLIQNDLDAVARTLTMEDKEQINRLSAAQLSLQRAQIHGFHLLGHLGAAMSTILLTQKPTPPDKPSHLTVVH